MSEQVTVRQLLEFAIGGGWGSETEEPGSVQVGVIRGADFPSVDVGDVSDLPMRYETAERVRARALRDGDIVLEISGGTKDRPTGRTVYVSRQLLSRSDAPLIPASFCRLVRVDRKKAVPRYVYYWLQAMYAAGRTWSYQHRSTGIANFQFDYFLDAERVRLPSIGEQKTIVEVLGALDDKIGNCRHAIELASRLSLVLYDEAVSESRRIVQVGSVAEFQNRRRLPLSARQRAERPGPFPYYGAAGVVDHIDDYLYDGTYVLVGEDGTVTTDGVHPMVQYVWGKFWVNNHAHVLTGRNISVELLRCALTRSEIVAAVTGAVQPKLSMSNLKAVPVLVPERSKELELALDVLAARERAATVEVTCLTTMRDALLPPLLSGELRVRDVEALVEGAV